MILIKFGTVSVTCAVNCRLSPRGWRNLRDRTMRLAVALCIVPTAVALPAGGRMYADLTLPAGTWRGSHLAPGATRRVQILVGGTTDTESTGAFVWHAGRMLCEWLSERTASAELAGSSVLDLGTGTGVCGIYAACLGASEVLLTDGGSESLLKLAESNVELNRMLYPTADVRVAPYSWGVEPTPVSTTAESWRWILGADLTYDQHAHQPLCAALHRLLLQPDQRLAAGSVDQSDWMAPRAILSHQHRLGDLPLEVFVDTATAQGLAVSELRRDTRVRDGEFEGIVTSILEVCL